MLLRITSLTPLFGLWLVLLVPYVARAQFDFEDGADDINDAFDIFLNLINSALPVVVGVGLLLFLWGLLVYMRKGDDTIERQKGRGFMVWGIVILFVMVAVWGLVGVLAQLTGVRGTGAPTITNQIPR